MYSFLLYISVILPVLTKYLRLLMEALDRIKKSNTLGLIKHFPRGHVIALGTLSVVLLCASMLPSESASASRHEQVIDIPALAKLEEQPVLETPDVAPPEPAKPVYRVTTQTVRSGDNLSLLFKRAGLNDRHMMSLLNGNPESKKLTKLYPGHELEFNINQDGELAELHYIKSQLSRLVYTKQESGYHFDEIIRQPDIQTTSRSGKISTSLFDAGMSANLDDRLIMEFANIFGWDVDFALDIRKGDTFKVVYEERFLDGEKLGNGDILAAEFVNQGETFRAVRYIDENGDASYYAPDGTSMRKAFLRAPLDFRRISSNFNPRRLHPITKVVRPHRGTDYAANRGTPVWAAGAGRVIASGYTKYNGNYIVIQHGNNIQTKYLHLHKRFVKKGERVKQKQRIGSVGSTGLSQAPHLHYEFLIDGVHRNPRTVISKLPKAKSIPKTELARFQAQTQVWIAELAPSTNTRYAASDILLENSENSSL